jgi:predicted dehydrogenase
MGNGGKVRVAIVGLGFGAEFIPIYLRHPNAEMYAICRRDRTELDACGDRFGVKTRYTDYNALLADPNVDAVHINSPIADHAPQSIAALKAGKHVASTVPAARTIDECRQIVELQRQGLHDDGDGGLQPRVLFVKRLCDSAELGRIQFLRGSHPAGWMAGGYWEGSADALRDALRQPLPRAPRQTCRARRLPRIRADR